jgi:hypothetical protein
MAFNKLKLGVTLGDLIRAINENFDAAVATALLGAINGIATLDENGLVPLSQLNLGALSEVVVLLGVTDTPPVATTVGDQYFDTGTGKIHTWDGDAWDAGVTPSKLRLYLNAANEVWYKWTGTAMVPFADVAQASSVRAFPFTGDDAGWAENLVAETWGLQIAVDTEGGDAAVVCVRNDGGETIMVDTAINVVGGVTFLTITTAEPFNGTAYVSTVA